MTPETLHILRDLLAAQQISAADPDAVGLATRALNALAELDTAIANTQGA